MPRTIDPSDICRAAEAAGVYELSPDPHVAAAEAMAILDLADSGAIAWTAPVSRAELLAGRPTAEIRLALR